MTDRLVQKLPKTLKSQDDTEVINKKSRVQDFDHFVCRTEFLSKYDTYKLRKIVMLPVSRITVQNFNISVKLAISDAKISQTLFHLF